MSQFPAPFTVRTVHRGDKAVVIPAGELDIATAPALDEALQYALESGIPRVVLDLRELEFIDSSGLRTLLLALRRADAAQAAFALVAGHGPLQRTLEIAGVHSMFEWETADPI